jgi:hypothetical protein
MWDEKILIYMAGIIDGEGCLSIELQAANKSCRKVDYYIPRMSVINTSYPLIEWLTKNFGGKHHIRKKEAKHKLIYVWNIFGQHLEDVVKAILPYMIIKADAAKIILEYRATVGDEWNISQETHTQRKAIYWKMRSVNKVGD